LSLLTPTAKSQPKPFQPLLARLERAMLRSLFVSCLFVFAAAAPANAVERANPAQDPEDRPRYLMIIVKACHQAEVPLKPTNQGKSYDNEPAPTREERLAAYKELGCIDVPIPMDIVLRDMTFEGCRGPAGYLAAMQFLETRQDLAEYPAVGGWNCLLTDQPVLSPVGQ
jgi:hypothetical protein